MCESSKHLQDPLLTKLLDQFIELHNTQFFQRPQRPVFSSSFYDKRTEQTIITRSRIKNKYNTWPSRENFIALKEIKNKYANLTKTAKKQYFAKSAENQPLTN